MESLGHPDSIPRPCQTCRADAPTMARQRADTPVTCRADTPAEQRCPERATSYVQALGLGNPDCMPRPCQTCRADTPTMARHRGGTQTRYPVPAVVRHVSAHRRCAPERQGDRARPARPRSYKKRRPRYRHQCLHRHHRHRQRFHAWLPLLPSSPPRPVLLSLFSCPSIYLESTLADIMVPIFCGRMGQREGQAHTGWLRTQQRLTSLHLA